MKKYILLSIVSLIVFVGPAGLQAAPEAFVPDSQYTFESVPEGEIIEHAFVIENRGDTPLHIDQVRTG